MCAIQARGILGFWKLGIGLWEPYARLYLYFVVPRGTLAIESWQLKRKPVYTKDSETEVSSEED